jgi:hypothetical protein
MSISLLLSSTRSPSIQHLLVPLLLLRLVIVLDTVLVVAIWKVLSNPTPFLWEIKEGIAKCLLLVWCEVVFGRVISKSLKDSLWFDVASCVFEKGGLLLLSPPVQLVPSIPSPLQPTPSEPVHILMRC